MNYAVYKTRFSVSNADFIDRLVFSLHYIRVVNRHYFNLTDVHYQNVGLFLDRRIPVLDAQGQDSTDLCYITDRYERDHKYSLNVKSIEMLIDTLWMNTCYWIERKHNQMIGNIRADNNGFPYTTVSHRWRHSTPTCRLVNLWWKCTF